MDLSIKQLLKKHSIRPSKKLGQIFLIDAGVLKKIVEVADLSVNDIVLEIGPGLGILTLELAKRVKRVITIEKDKKMCEVLSEILDAGNVRNVEIINGDILKFPSYQLPVTDYKIIANLPYYITSPVIRKFLESENPPQLMVLMVQKEVAQRICAKLPQMNLLAVAVQFYSQPKIISYVSKNSFWPQPKVDSAIIKIIPIQSKDYSLRRPPTARAGTVSPDGHRGTSEGEDERVPTLAGRACLRASNPSKFFKLVKAGFSSKRKMLINNLSSKFKIKKLTLEKIFKQININPQIRAENLSIQDWVNLYETIKSYLEK